MYHFIAIILYSLCVLPQISEATDSIVRSSHLRGGKQATKQETNGSLRGSKKTSQKETLTDSITSLKLIDSVTKEEILDLFNNTEVDLSALGYTDPTFNIQAVTSKEIGDIQSVQFGFNEKSNFTVADEEPYTLCEVGADGSNQCTVLSTGTHTVMATPYEELNAGGASGGTLRVNFTIVEESTKPSTLPEPAEPVPPKASLRAPAMAPVAFKYAVPPPTRYTPEESTSVL